MWRVSGGIFRGRHMKSPPAGSARLTQDRIRKSVFDIIREKVEGADCLDLFCGSGSFGIEALSRGAGRVTFVDKSHKCINTVKENVTLLSVSDKSGIICGDACGVIQRFSPGSKYGLVFMDPPYHTELAKKILIKLSQCDILSNKVLVIVEHYKKVILPERTGELLRIRQEFYGDTNISFYEKHGSLSG